MSLQRCSILGVSVLAVLIQCSYSACPASDYTGDCAVDFHDLAVLAGQWLDAYDVNDLVVMSTDWLVEGIRDDPSNLYWISVSEPGFTGQISKYEITNGQYCCYLNAAFQDGLIQVYWNRVFAIDDTGHARTFFETYDIAPTSQIYFSNGFFYVRTRDGYDMSNHPVVEVSAYGADAFCSYYGYYLPSETQWQAIADYDGTYVYGCGLTIDQSIANYLDVVHANPLGLTTEPYTTPVGYYPAAGYDLYDMAGNVREWTRTAYASYRMVRGGGWNDVYSNCEVTTQFFTIGPHATTGEIGFRVCRTP